MSYTKKDLSVDYLIITGAPNSGKSTVVNILTDIVGNERVESEEELLVIEDSIVDPIKVMIDAYDYNLLKNIKNNENVRNLICAVKNIMQIYAPESLYYYIVEGVKFCCEGNLLPVINIRNPKDIDKCIDLLTAQGFRGKIVNIVSDISVDELANYPYDDRVAATGYFGKHLDKLVSIDNRNCSLEVLKKRVEKFFFTLLTNKQGE